jgi:hydrogenase expression/formation protein HypC
VNELASAPRRAGDTACGQGSPGPHGHGNACITCSDAAVQVRVTRLLAGDLAIVDVGRGEEEVSVALVTARPGDMILVHAGEAIAVVAGAR